MCEDSNQAEALITPQQFREYLDECIRSWRKKLQDAVNDEDELMCRCYADAFQSVRSTVFGGTLPSEEHPHLVIQVKDMNSVPIVRLDGKIVMGKVDIAYHWNTKDESGFGNHEYSIRHLEPSGCLQHLARERKFIHKMVPPLPSTPFSEG